MPRRLDYLQVANGDLVLAKDMPDALTAATLVFEDGARQTFTADGKTTYLDHGGSTQGEWSIVEDGAFSSFWPPDYRAVYGLRWIVEDGAVSGLSFIQAGRGDRYDGRYESIPELSWHPRRLPNVATLRSQATGLAYRDGRVSGVRYRPARSPMCWPPT
jgi:hypothetical protein